MVTGMRVYRLCAASKLTLFRTGACEDHAPPPPPLSEYEALRIKNIRINAQALAGLGLGPEKNARDEQGAN